ncbi:MAG: hypothetical protein KIH09_09795, partial [Candidatus Freyarchaeota archaeon]|nr:hypothetical protein [Candidatus Jordarchaeia archaeon]
LLVMAWGVGRRFRKSSTIFSRLVFFQRLVIAPLSVEVNVPDAHWTVVWRAMSHPGYLPFCLF